MYFVYILRSISINRYYIGSTENVEKRLSYHNSGKVRSTKAFRPWELVHTVPYDDRTDAVKREKQIKSYKGGMAFKKLLKL